MPEILPKLSNDSRKFKPVSLSIFRIFFALNSRLFIEFPCLI
nr:MAG TPA: hypothetical protein [Caudoviricetes sp.]